MLKDLSILRQLTLANFRLCAASFVLYEVYNNCKLEDGKLEFKDPKHLIAMAFALVLSNNWNAIGITALCSITVLKSLESYIKFDKENDRVVVPVQYLGLLGTLSVLSLSSMPYSIKSTGLGLIAYLGVGVIGCGIYLYQNKGESEGSLLQGWDAYLIDHLDQNLPNVLFYIDLLSRSPLHMFTILGYYSITKTAPLCVDAFKAKVLTKLEQNIIPEQYKGQAEVAFNYITNFGVRGAVCYLGGDVVRGFVICQLALSKVIVFADWAFSKEAEQTEWQDNIKAFASRIYNATLDGCTAFYNSFVSNRA
jgi:hypothetical protein